MSRVRTVKDDAEFTALMKEAAQKDAKTVVDFNASWCGPCKAIGAASPVTHFNAFLEAVCEL